MQRPYKFVMPSGYSLILLRKLNIPYSAYIGDYKTCDFALSVSFECDFSKTSVKIIT